MWLVRVVIRRYIDILIIIINFPYSTCIRPFFGSSILTSLFIFKCFFGLYNKLYSTRQFLYIHAFYSDSKPAHNIIVMIIFFNKTLEAIIIIIIKSVIIIIQLYYDVYTINIIIALTYLFLMD